MTASHHALRLAKRIQTQGYHCLVTFMWHSGKVKKRSVVTGGLEVEVNWRRKGTRGLWVDSNVLLMIVVITQLYISVRMCRHFYNVLHKRRSTANNWKDAWHHSSGKYSYSHWRCCLWEWLKWKTTTIKYWWDCGATGSCITWCNFFGDLFGHFCEVDHLWSSKSALK